MENAENQDPKLNFQNYKNPRQPHDFEIAPTRSTRFFE